MLTGVDPPLDGAVVLLKHVIKYGTGRCRQSSARLPSALSCATAGGYAAWPSVLMSWFSVKWKIRAVSLATRSNRIWLGIVV